MALLGPFWHSLLRTIFGQEYSAVAKRPGCRKIAQIITWLVLRSLENKRAIGQPRMVEDPRQPGGSNLPGPNVPVAIDP